VAFCGLRQVEFRKDARHVLSSSGTRLTNEFRWLLDMIIWVAWSAVGGGEGAVFLGAVMPDRMNPDDLVVAGDLDGFGDDRDLGATAAPATAGPVVGAGEGDVAGGVDYSGHAHSFAGLPGTAAALSQWKVLVAAGVGFTPLDMLGDQDVAVEDADQVLGGDGLDRLSGVEPVVVPTYRAEGGFVVGDRGVATVGVSGSGAALGNRTPTYALRGPLPVLTLALTRNFGCMVGISRRPQAR
jgi:hypothetical protein